MDEYTSLARSVMRIHSQLYSFESPSCACTFFQRKLCTNVIKVGVRARVCFIIVFEMPLTRSSAKFPRRIKVLHIENYWQHRIYLLAIFELISFVSRMNEIAEIVVFFRVRLCFIFKYLTYKALDKFVVKMIPER